MGAIALDACLHGGGDTLYLRVAPGGSKAWIQQLTVNGKRRDIGLGGRPLVSFAEVCDQAFETRRAKVPTFREAAEQTFEANRVRWRNTKTTTNWLQGMAKRVLPVLGDGRSTASAGRTCSAS